MNMIKTNLLIPKAKKVKKGFEYIIPKKDIDRYDIPKGSYRKGSFDWDNNEYEIYFLPDKIIKLKARE